MPRSQDLKSCDSTRQFLIISISTYPNLEVLYVLQNRRLLDCWFARRLSTDHAFLANGVRVEKNLKALLMKVTENLGGGAGGEILSSINENLGGSHRAEQCWEIGVPQSGLTLGMSTSACPLILYCRSGVTAGVLAELPCSIVLADSDRNGRRSRGLSRWSHNVHGWSWWRFDVDAWLFKGMILSWTAQENDRKNDIESIIQSNQQLTDWDQPNEWLGTSKQPRIIDWPSDWGQTTHPKAVGLCNAVATRPMITWSNTWSGTWSNTWSIDIIFLEANKPYLHYYQTRHCHSHRALNLLL